MIVVHKSSLCITSINKKIPFTVHGKGNTVRNFIYVDDVSTAIETILFKGIIGEIYNIGSKNEFNVIEIIKKIVKLMKNTDNIEPYITYISDRLFNDLRYSVSNKKLMDLGWCEKVPFDIGLENTIKWYMEYDEDNWFKST